jgi:predicted O-linked N-acetylglucosamine transferase (SPINDLY family)
MTNASIAALLQDALQLHRQGGLRDAISRYEQVLRIDPANGEAQYHLARAYCEQGRLADGIDLLHNILSIDPGQGRAYRLLGMALGHAGRHAEALAALDRALDLGSVSAAIHGSRADALVALGRFDEAVESFDRALLLDLTSVPDWCNRGAALHELGRYQNAAESFDRAIALAPDFAEAHCNRGAALTQLGRLAEAIASFDVSLAINPAYADALSNRGEAFRRLGRLQDALASFDRALVLAPDHVATLCNRAIVLASLARHEDALASLDRALTLRPAHADALYLRGKSLAALGRLEAAILSYEHAAAHGHRLAFGPLLLNTLSACNWERLPAARDLERRVEEGQSIISPFALLAFAIHPAQQLRSVQHFVQHEFGSVTKLDSPRPRRTRDKMRVAYMSADFGPHAVTSLITGLLEHHDRSEFEITGVSVGPEEPSAMRARVARACDHFHEFGAKSDAEIADLLNAMELDIIVDLTGLTENARPGVLARRPAPIQVSSLGYLGSMGVDWIDYVLADKHVLPFDQQPFYTEKIVHLPDCFLVNDDKLPISPRLPSRGEVGLPTQGFVFCSFNNSYKFRAPVFAAWMRLLREVRGSVLWLLAANADAVANLRREATRHGIDPSRLVFAQRVDAADHLARQQLADLFLDTSPYNAGATAAGALWAGVPVLTLVGETFVGRMAASMLHAAGLPELATASLDEYEATARKLATDPALLQDIRAKLDRNRLTYPLFDTDRSRRHIEAAYKIMGHIHRNGEPCRSFVVPPLE